MFTPVDPKVSFPALEERILDRWKAGDIFRRSVEERPESKLFVFYEGPPTANGRPGIHHVLARAFKDLIPRFKTMQGYRVPRKGGWDTHGLPVELEVEKELGLKSKPEIEAYGIAAFNRKCKESVSRYVDEWTRMSDRIAFWADMENPYVTWHNDYIETGWWIFKQMWDHGLVYQDYRSTPHCPRCGTSLSDHEVSLGYEEDTPDPSVYIKFRVDGAEFARATGVETGDRPVSLVAWTTTPWTLPGNTALAARANATYGVYAYEGEYLVVAEALGAKLLGEEAVLAGKLDGESLAGLEYEPLYTPETTGDATVLRFGHDGHLRPLEGSTKGLRRVITADYVSLDDGSGIVHIAPAFGSEDFSEGKIYRLLFVQHVDTKGLMSTGVPGAGLFVKEADRCRDRRPQGAGPPPARGHDQAHLPVLLALWDAAAVLREAKLVHPHHPPEGEAAGGQQPDQLASCPPAVRALRQLAGKQHRLGGQPRALLGHAAAVLDVRRVRQAGMHRLSRRTRRPCHRSGEGRGDGRSPPPLHRRDHHHAATAAATHDARTRSGRRLVRQRRDAVRPMALSVRERRTSSCGTSPPTLSARRSTRRAAGSTRSTPRRRCSTPAKPFPTHQLQERHLPRPRPR